MADDKLLKILVDLKEVETEIKAALKGSPDSLANAATKLHNIVKALEADYWDAIEKSR